MKITKQGPIVCIYFTEMMYETAVQVAEEYSNKGCEVSLIDLTNDSSM